MASTPGLSMPMKFDNTLGALLLGGMFAMALWGITCVQTYTYFTRPKKDRRIVQGLVCSRAVPSETRYLTIFDTFDSSLNIHFIYHYTVSNYLQPMALMVPIWSVIAFSNFAIRTMFAQRIYRLSKGNLILTGFIASLSSVIFALTGTIITAKAFQLKTYLELDTLSNLMYITFAFGTGSDLSVASCSLSGLLTVPLLFEYHNSASGRTDSMIRVLVMYTVNTGLIVALDAAAGMIAYIVMPNNFIFLGFYLLLSKCEMNARQDMREKMRDPVSIHLSDISQSYQRRYDLESVPGSAMSEKSLGQSKCSMP
ncbi:hypothetical protein FA13DRAFT_1755957 [Coprinellus micaceus]|uniref:DUF6534 domain-containing protein n=1 Tax=Coprinellus micaceus TaxID=71717 RepID=A0A4Y7T1V3_COPMI|nr:hypothetical protein FA13DRAFT_1755957 [Coprinellus micaceus]